MSAWMTGVALFLLVNLTVGLARVYRGPTPADRVLAAQLFGTTTVGILLLLAEAMPQAALRDVALLFVLLAVLVTLAFIKLPGRAEEHE